MRKILIIQTSFIGDVILATSLLEKLHDFYPESQLCICVRKGNERLFDDHPFLHKAHVWNKKEKKYRHLIGLIKEVRSEGYDTVVNLQRFAASGLLTVFSGAIDKIGFNKNPFSFLFTKKFKHEISANGIKHEVERNQTLISHLTDDSFAMPRLYPGQEIFNQTNNLVKGNIYITLSPASAWYTKQLPKSKWIELIQKLSNDISIFILGGTMDKDLAQEIMSESKRDNIINLAGELSLLGSAALMQGAKMNFVNDSAPLHLCSALNAPVTSFFCSTVPAFGFAPLSDESYILETKEELPCRPCGLHGLKECPKGHFKCGNIDIETI